MSAQHAVGSAADLSAHKLAYDVVSIRPSTFEGMSINSSGDRFVARGTTLWGLLFNAYKLRPHDDIPGLPGWAKSERFDVEAGMDPDTFAELQRFPGQEQSEQRALMLQALLADRFQLKMHYESREQPIYALVIAKGGARLKQSPPDKTSGSSSWSSSGQIDTRGMPIEEFAFRLSDILGRVVVDKTGLTGKYDIHLKWTPDESQETRPTQAYPSSRRSGNSLASSSNQPAERFRSLSSITSTGLPRTNLGSTDPLLIYAPFRPFTIGYLPNRPPAKKGRPYAHSRLSASHRRCIVGHVALGMHAHSRSRAVHARHPRS